MCPFRCLRNRHQAGCGVEGAGGGKLYANQTHDQCSTEGGGVGWMGAGVVGLEEGR